MLLNRLVYPLVIPVVILVALLYVHANIQLLPEDYLPLLNYAPYVLGIVALILSVQFNQMRFMIITLLLGYSFLMNMNGLQSPLSAPSVSLLFTQVTLITPILLALVVWYPERGVINAQSVTFIVLSAGVIAGLQYVFGMLTTQEALSDYISPSVQSFSVLSTTGLGLFILAIAHQVYRYWDSQFAIDGALLIILIALAYSYVHFDMPAISTFAHSTAMLVIIWGLLKQSHDMAYRDELTSLPGRRALNEALKAPGRKYVIAMMDVDHFKKFNDKYGHDIGDDVLKMVAGKLSRVTGDGKAYRYGGEEFTILFRGKDMVRCVPHLEAVREDIANYFMSIRERQNRPLSTKEGQQNRGKATKLKGVSVTISIGVAEKNDNYSTPEEVIKAADQALYKAKKAGRNCLVADKS